MIHNSVQTVRIFSTVILLLVINSFTHAQFSLISITPSDGSTAVPLETDIVFTFNKSVDMSFHYPKHDGFFMALFLSNAEKFGHPDSVEPNEDFTRITFYGVSLLPDTKYTIGIMDAKSTSGETLDLPVLVTFTTGSSLPAGKISGKVTSSVGDSRGALVGVSKDFILTGTEPEIVGVVNSSTGEYTLNYVTAGEYWATAVKDLNGDGNPDSFEEGDALGLYNPDADIHPDLVTVTEAGELKNIDINLSVLDPVNVKSNLHYAFSTAASLYADVYFSGLLTDRITAEGSALFTLYRFYSPSEDKTVNFIGAETFVMQTSFSEFPEEIPAMEIDTNFIELKTALDSSYVHGGADFISAHPDFRIRASLLKMDFDRLPPLNKIISREALLKEFIRTVWVLEYEVTGVFEKLDVFIDAFTGENVVPGYFPTGEPTTAAFNLSAAGKVATDISDDYKLSVVTTHTGGIKPDGKSEAWGYVFYSVSLNDFIVVIVSDGNVLFQGPLDWDPLPAPDVLPESWIDSDAAIAIAESGGGAAYRSRNAEHHIEAALFTMFFPERDSVIVWRFMYDSPTEAPLEILVNAVSSEIVTDVNETISGNSAPSDFQLLQNYPNPFNPTTTIQYSIAYVETLHATSLQNISLKVYDMLGREVATLVNEQQQPGTYKVEFDGSNLSNGVYFYKIRAGNFTDTKKLILLK